MATNFVVRVARGLKSAVPASVVAGGMLFTTDTKEFYIGSGSGVDAIKIDVSNIIGLAKGSANGICPLGADGKIPDSYLPNLAIGATFVVGTQAAMLALTAEVGDVAVRTDSNKTFRLTVSPASTLGNWQELLSSGTGINTVNSKSGSSITLNTDDIGEGSTNLYYTQAKADARVSAGIAALKGAVSGLCPLDGSSLVPVANIPVLDCGTF